MREGLDRTTVHASPKYIEKLLEQLSKQMFETYFENLSKLRLSVKTSFFQAGPNAAGAFCFSGTYKKMRLVA